MQQRVHRPVLQVFPHLPAVTTRRGSRIGVALTAALVACACALAAAMLTCVAALAAHTGRRPEEAHSAATGSPCSGESLLPTAANARAADAATLCLVNRLRGARGLRSLRANRELRHVASSQVDDHGPQRLLRRCPAHRADAAVARRDRRAIRRTPADSRSARTSRGAPAATPPRRTSSPNGWPLRRTARSCSAANIATRASP